MIWWILLSFMAGGTFGVVLSAMMFAARNADEYEREMEQ